MDPIEPPICWACQQDISGQIPHTWGPTGCLYVPSDSEDSEDNEDPD